MDRVNVHSYHEEGVNGRNLSHDSVWSTSRRKSSRSKICAPSPESVLHSRYRSESSSSISPSPTSMSTSEDETVPDMYGDGQSVQPPAATDLPCLPLSWIIGLTLAGAKTDGNAHTNNPVPLLKLLFKQ